MKLQGLNKKKPKILKNFRLDEKTILRLEELAKSNGVSQNKTIEYLINEKFYKQEN